MAVIRNPFALDMQAGAQHRRSDFERDGLLEQERKYKIIDCAACNPTGARDFRGLLHRKENLQ